MSGAWWPPHDPDLGTEPGSKYVGRRDWNWFTPYTGTSTSPQDNEDATTPWAEYDHAYRGTCSNANGANVLQIADNPGAPHLNPVPDSTWGLHLTDANIALGNLTHIVKLETNAFFQR